LGRVKQHPLQDTFGVSGKFQSKLLSKVIFVSLLFDFFRSSTGLFCNSCTVFLISHINKELKSILQPDAPYDSDGIRLSARSKGESAALKVTPFIFILLFIRHPKMQM